MLSDDFSISKQLVTGFYPRWFIDDAGQPVIFDGQPSEFCDLYATLIRKERFSDRFNGKRIAINRIPEVTLMLVILNILINASLQSVRLEKGIGIDEYDGAANW